jgi:eukaryotic-like serine/threonine-protein kinase
MKPGRWQEIERLYHLVQELKRDEREVVLQKECAGDESLRREVESLLVRPSEGRDFLEAPALEVAAMALAKDRLNEPPIDLTGRTIGHYRVLEKIGEGGMGVVYKARDLRLRRFVALKVLPPEHVADPDRERRFVQEARAASALNHPNIVTIHDITWEGGTDFIVMEYVEGKTLDQRIGHRGLRLSDALKYAVQIADALAKAHSAGIVHRDLKPTNIMVNEDGVVKVLDFGLAKLREQTQGDEYASTATVDVEGKPITDEGVIIGTVSYMSPEQAEGKKIDVRSDIFSLGSVLYEMVTGQRAFQGTSKMSTLAAILHQEPKSVSSIMQTIPADLEKIINRCLRKDTERRFQHMDDVKIALLELKEDSDSGKLVGAAPAPRKRRSYLWVSLILGLVACLALAVWLWQRRSRPVTPEAPMTAVPLITYPGEFGQPTFSPDGNEIAFTWNGKNQDNFDIYRKLIGPGEPLRLTTNPAGDFSPAWSPDGKSIAFGRPMESGNRGAIFIIPALGGPERRLAQIDFPNIRVNLAWSPDSRYLVTTDQNDSGQSHAHGLHLISAESGEKTRLTSPPVTGSRSATIIGLRRLRSVSPMRTAKSTVPFGPGTAVRSYSAQAKSGALDGLCAGSHSQDPRAALGIPPSRNPLARGLMILPSPGLVRVLHTTVRSGTLTSFASSCMTRAARRVHLRSLLPPHRLTLNRSTLRTGR